MRHDIRVEGHGYRLRPIADNDAALVVELRSNPELNRYLHAGAIDIPQQIAWFHGYYERPGDFYFVIERRTDGLPEGVISIYDAENGQAEWGRWILRPESLAAVESAWLIYRTCFERLELDRICCRTVAANEKVVSFHDSCGIEARRMLPRHFELQGHWFDAVEHRVDRTAWVTLAPRLEKLARALARRSRHD